MDLYKQYAISAILAKFAYSDSDTLLDLWFKMRDSKRDSISNVFRGIHGVPQFYSDNETEAKGFSILKDKTLFIVFRGAKNLQDVIVDIDLKRVPLLENNKKILVHEGFMKQFTALKFNVINTIEKYLKDIDTIQVIGHSLGGAVATLFASHIANYYSVKVICHTFGSPRVGNMAYAEWFQGCVKDNVRFTKPGDPVVEMPGSAYFQHVSNATCIAGDLSVLSMPDGKWYWRLFRANMKCWPTVTHNCDKYIEPLMNKYMELKKKMDDIRLEVIG